MYFENPNILFCLWILPVVAGLLVYAHRRRMATARQFADPAMVRRLMPSLENARPWIKGALILLGIGCLIVAGARPRFGVYFEKIAQRGVDLFVLLDVSRSMTAEDVAPNRLQRAKSDIRDLLKKLSGDRVGLIVFAGKPVVKVPLTTDQGFFRMVLDDIDTQSAPRGGSLIGDAIRKSIEVFPERTDRDQVIVLITDGEDQDSYPQEAAKQAAERGIKIFTVGLGDSAEGSRVPVADEPGRSGYLKYQGQEVWSKVDERLLSEIAFSTRGAYIAAGTRAYDLGQVYEEHLAGLARGEIRAEKRKRYRERFQIFVCLGIALLLIEMAIPGYPEKQKGVGSLFRLLRAKAMPPHGKRLPTPFCFLLVLGPAALCRAEGVADQVRRGVAHYGRGEYEAAGSAFADADVARPDDPRIAFDRACVYAAEGDADKAVEMFQKAALSPDRKLTARCRYNLGCLVASRARSLFGKHSEDASAEVRQEGLGMLARAVGHYRDCLKLQPDHADARHNLEVIRLWIKHMQALWQERDRQKQRKEMGLLEFLLMIEGRQRELRSAGKSLAEVADSPRRRQALTATESSQRQLAEEIEPLKEKIAAALKPSPGAGGSAGSAPSQPPAEEAEEALKLLTRLADDSATAMLSAAESLAGAAVGDALSKQTEAVESLDQIYMAVAPFANLVQRAVKTQQGLVEQSAAVVETPDRQAEVDFADAAWNQRFVARWSQIMPAKARQGLKNLKETAAAVAAPAGQTQSPDPAAAEKQKEQIEGLKKSMEKAVELAPKVRELATEAAGHLSDEKPADALPKQEEALRLLKEIAEPLPKQKQQQQQQGNQQDQNQQDQQQQQQQSPEQQKQKQQQKQEEMSKQRAEAVLRKARQRQQQRRDLQKQLRQYIYRPDKVEKDW